MCVVSEASSGRMLLDELFEAKPDLVLLDLALPGMNGFAVTRELRRQELPCKVLILSVYETDEDVLEAFASGAHGFALKSQTATEILGAIRSVMRGGLYRAPRIPASLLERHLSPKEDPASDPRPLAPLSERERDVFDLVLRGFSNEATSRELTIALKTVESHRARINKKLGIHSTADLIRFGSKHGLLSRLSPVLQPSALRR